MASTLTAPVVERIGTQQRRVLLSRTCRVALVWPDDPMDLVPETLDACPDLLRLYLVRHVREEPPMAPADARMRIVTVGRDDDPVAQLRGAFGPDDDFFADGRVDLHIGPRRRESFPSLCETLMRELLEHTRRVVSATAHRTLHGWHRAANVLANASRLVDGPTIENLQGIAAGEPVVVVGAGPSLDSDVAFLRERRADFRLVACDSAWEPLARNGIVPDLIVTTDGSERVWRYFARFSAAGPHVPVVAMLHSGWPVARYYPGPILAARSAHGIDEWLAPRLPVLDGGLCVGHAAFEIARIIGGTPIILAGFDLGFRDGRYHPVHMAVPYADFAPPPSEALTRVPGNDGNPMLTDQSMLLYLRDFETRIARTDVPVWNVTTAGARIAGTTRGTLDAALRATRVPTRRVLPIAPVSAAPRRGAAAVRGLELANLDRRLSLIHVDPFQGSPDDAVPGLRLEDPAFAALLDIAEPLPLIEGRNQWRTWGRLGRPTPATDGLRRRLDACVADLLSTLALFRQMARIAEQRPRLAGNTTLVAGTGWGAATGTPTPDTLARNGRKVVPLAGDLNDFAALWRHIEETGADSLVFADGAIWPAGWGVPGCAVIDYRTQTPPKDVRPEFWLPGYTVLAASRDLGDQWRAFLPPDRPVWVWNSARGEACRHGSQDFLSLHRVLSCALEEMLAVEAPAIHGTGGACCSDDENAHGRS